MLRLLEDKLEVVDSMKMQPLPVCCLPSVPKFEHAKPQSPGECTGASLVEPESFMSLNIKDRGDAKACAGGHNPDASIPAFGKLKMLSSEACHKNYVIFDRCEGKNTVILHPSWLNSPPYYPAPQPCFAREAKYFVEAKFDFRSSAALSTVGLEVPVYSEAIAMQLQQKMASSNEARCSLIEFVNSGHAQNLKKDIMKAAGFLSDIEEESHNEFHENTEEIDALLSSDDELSSTGHSPSGASSNCLSEAKNGHGNKIIGKKRKLGYSTLDEVDDADSGPIKLAPDHTFLNSRRSGSFVSFNFLSESDHKDTFSGVEASKVSNRVEKSATVNDVFAEKGECESKQSSGTFGGGLVDSSKRIKIKNNLQQLKNVVPGGDCLDAAGVLGQTIQYVKCLQSRLRDLEAAIG